MKALKRRASCLKARVKQSTGIWGEAVLSLSKAEWMAVLVAVVMPFFVSAPRLLSPSWPGSVTTVVGWHNGGNASPVDAPSSSAPMPTWLERPGLVKLDKRSGAKRKEICTACVYPSVRGKVRHTDQGQAYPRRVKWWYAGKSSTRPNDRYVWLTFRANAKVVAGPGKAARKSRSTGLKRSFLGWVGMQNARSQDVVVGLYLHNLIYYLKKGVKYWDDMPFANRPVGRGHVVLHLGECRKGCCCPWHLKLRPHRENRVRYLRAYKNRGRLRDFSYAEAPVDKGDAFSSGTSTEPSDDSESDG